MRDVVVIGGGLTGLSACYQLEKLGLRYTAIELKRRFGGTIRTYREDGFIMDASAFAFSTLADEPWLPELGLSDQILAVDDGFIFRDGTESLSGALAEALNGGRLMRMAVSSLGRLRGRFTICLENGMMLDAGALILAAPARFAARMLYNLAPDAAERLTKYRYETSWEVALGFHKGALPPSLPASDLFPVRTTDHPARVPDSDHCLIQLAMAAPSITPPAEVIRNACVRLGIRAAPIAARAQAVDAAPSLHDDEYRDNLRQIRASLPAGISLVGSDFLSEAPVKRGLAQLAERMNAGRQAALAASAYLKRRKSV